MNEINIFQETITNQVLADLQADSEKYTGLYVDMNNAPERKYVKEKASTIKGLLKQVDRARIDKSRDYKNMVEEEASRINEALEEANRPFTLLIDEYTEERKAILAKEKAAQEARELVIQIAKDHIEGLELNALYDFQAAEKRREQEARDEAIRKEAAENAKREAEEANQRKIDEAKQAAQREVEAAQRREREAVQNAELEKKLLKAKEVAEAEELAKREADKEHRRALNKEAACALAKALCISDDTAKSVIRAIASGDVPNVKINY